MSVSKSVREATLPFAAMRRSEPVPGREFDPLEVLRFSPCTVRETIQSRRVLTAEAVHLHILPRTFNYCVAAGRI
jgi:hypothetical protein